MAVNPLWKRLREEGGVSAEDLIEAFNLTKPPIPVAGIAKGLGVEVYYRENAGWDGALSIDQDEVVARIFVEKLHSKTRQRFTIAHELGHLMLHPDTFIHRDTKKVMLSNSFKEKEANSFAASLLMPQWMVEFAFERLTQRPDALASLFEVSPEAMRYRMHNLNLVRLY